MTWNNDCLYCQGKMDDPRCYQMDTGRTVPLREIARRFARGVWNFISDVAFIAVVAAILVVAWVTKPIWRHW